MGGCSRVRFLRRWMLTGWMIDGRMSVVVDDARVDVAFLGDIRLDLEVTDDARAGDLA